MYIYCILFIHSLIDGHLGCFFVLAIINMAGMNIGVHVSFQIMFFFSRYMSQSVISKSYDSSIFNFIGNIHNVFYSDCTNLCSQQ